MFQESIQTAQAFIQTQIFPPLYFWQSLFTWNYWVNPIIVNPPSYLLFFILSYLVIAYLLFTWQFILRKSDEKKELYRPIITNIWSIFFFISVILAIYNFSYYEGIVYLSSRLVLLSMSVVVIIWVAVLVYLIKKVIPKKYQDKVEKERFFKYLPNKKNKARS